MQKRIQKDRQRLDDLNCERQSLEHVIERTAQLYRQSHLERRHMIDTWNAAVQSLYLRDMTIQETIEVKFAIVNGFPLPNNICFVLLI